MADNEPSRTEQLERFLAAAEPGRRATVTSYKGIIGGYSRETAMATVRWDDGPEDRLILRADPPGNQGVFLSERDPEWELLRALADVDALVIPKPLWYDGTGEYMGAKCIVMEHCEGTPLQLTLAERDDLAEAVEIYLQVAASLQRIPLDALPPDMHRPQSWDEYIDSAIAIYEETERRLPDSSPVIRFVSAWLHTHKPPPVPLAVVHGDFQPGNILVAEGRPPVVIDWEFTRIGDPREDIGYYSQNPLPTNLYSANPEGFLRRYRQLTGLNEEQVNPEVIRYFFILGMAKLMCQMVDGAAAIAEGAQGGLMNTFLINSVSYFHDAFLKICRGASRQ